MSIISNIKTLNSFSNYSFDSFFIISLSVSIFSLAGVPPFLGFFSKLFILNILSNSNFFILYFLLFIILFLGLYFYIQNLRFLHSTNYGYSSSSYVINERKSLNIYYYLILIILLLTFGFFFIDDLLLIFIWFLI
jgi:NADH:ubiquinone oxidoreductase subunit 2 (subunit N)